MADSFTLTLTGNSSILDVEYFPPIELSPFKTYVLGLVELLTFNSIPNIDNTNNKFYYKKIESNTEWKIITIPIGSYEIEDIEEYLKAVDPDLSIKIKPNNNELHSEVYSENAVISFEFEDSVGSVLGFSHRRIEAKSMHKSDLPVSILKVNALRVECNITTGAYVNNKLVHTIHEFFPTVPPGYKIIEVPSNVIYLPIAVRTIQNLQVRIVDQNGELVNFRGETITIRLHVKSLG